MHILGAGAAALAAARALAYHGIAASVTSRPMRSGPVLLLNRPTLQLLQDLFGCEAALRAQGRTIRGRLVAWGSGSSAPDLIAEPGLAIAAGTLHRLLCEALSSGAGKDLVRIAPSQHDGFDGDAIWTVEARGKAAGGFGKLAAFGERTAICSSARLSTEADPSLCAVEAIAQGWLFLLPIDGRRAALQAIVPQAPEGADQTLGTLLAQSRLIARLVAALDGEARMLPCAPRFRMEPARPAWLAAGDAALSFDPLCGDGTGQALRCGLLAAAVIGAIEQGEPEEGCLGHYRHRLRRAMLAHLKATISFYEIAPSRDIWQHEIEMADQALDRIASGERDIGPTGRARYRLERFSLVRASS